MPIARRRLLGQTGLLCGAFLAARFVVVMRQPSSVLAPLPFPRQSTTIRNGIFYWATTDVPGLPTARTLSVFALPIQGGEPKTLFREQGAGFRIEPLGFVGEHFYYLERPLEQKQKAEPKPGTLKVGITTFVPSELPPDPKTYQGVYRWGDSPKKAGEYADLLPSVPVAPLPKAHLFRLPLAGGLPQEIAHDIPGESLSGGQVALTPTTLCWLQRRPDERRTVSRLDGKYRQEIRGRSDLMVLPLSGGVSRQAASGLQQQDILFADGDFVCWKTLQPFPQTGKDLQMVSLRDGTRTTLQNFGGDRPPVLYNDRLYWAEVERGSRRTSSTPAEIAQWPVRVRSSRRDGSDNRVLEECRFGEYRPLLNGSVFQTAGQALFRLSFVPVEGNQPIRSAQETTSYAERILRVQRLASDGSDRFETAAQVQAGISALFLDGETAYYIRLSDGRNWMSRLSSEPSIPGQESLYTLALSAK